ncbi:CocE/NonD family hydrolase [Nocardia cyriacigeorgica]|uniref:CocE/NonD family hydrolase n=1 Tax=Nocardia cyriacigeorgica TaxID=135487 RepID=UPI00189626FF|nr:CocE/NonD family hydrolase [Nocardia cyriacigeorgica]MBF6159902.1 CocE/NonD family hydrolase [Nocardia cyriacigeorgica]MBF6198986.1 CocE/NonD family hydrolase [Nocardia cyriacigeorgica]
MRLTRRVQGVAAAFVILLTGGAAGMATLAENTVAYETPAPAAAPDELARQWTQTHDGPQPYPDVHIDWDVPITMSDGVVLKANVYRPIRADGQVETTPLPTVVNLTPYTKLMTNLIDSAVSLPGLQQLTMDLVGRINLSGTPVSGFEDLLHALDGGTVQTVLGLDRKLIRSGYTQVVADVRGTGFSQGTWNTLGAREQLDTREVIDWAAAQPWSNGRIAMSGGSYSGINQLRAAENPPASLRAIFPVEPGSDLMRDVVAPGGGIGTTFLPMWLNSVNNAKLLPDISSMLNGTFDWRWFNDRRRDPLTNFDLLAQALLTPSLHNVPPALSAALDENSAFREGIMGRPEKVGVPTFVYGGWHDIFANSATTLYNAIPLPADQKKLVVGDTYHANPGAGTGVPGAPARLDVLQRAWFDHWLKDIDNGVTGFGPVTVWEQGGGWVTLAEFPKPGMTHRRVYLSGAPSGTTRDSLHDGSLTGTPAPETTRLTVAPGLTTACSRDAAQGSAGMTAVIDACAKDSRIAERNGLTFTSAEITEPTVISGPINVHLNTVHDAADGYWNVTVNDVAPDGTSTVLSTGQLTSSLRAIDEAKSTRSANGDLTAPHNPITLDSVLPVPPGEAIALDIAVIPTQAILQPGHRLRVDVFAGNSPKALAFRPMLNASELKPQHLVLDPNAPSFVNLPTDRPIAFR